VTSSEGPTRTTPEAAAERDLQLVQDARRGNVAAFNQLVLSYQDLLYNVALRLVGDPETAADVTQDAFISAYRHLDQFKGGSFRAWLLRIVTNASYDLLRDRHRHNSESLDLLIEESSYDAPDPGELPETVVLRQEWIGELEEGLRALAVEQRAVLILYDLHGLSYEEIAATLQISLGTVKSRLNRARRRLRDYVMSHPELWKP
jgi:RNA polymerase sigma factor (sigma-70 family)